MKTPRCGSKAEDIDWTNAEGGELVSNISFNLRKVLTSIGVKRAHEFDLLALTISLPWMTRTRMFAVVLPAGP